MNEESIYYDHAAATPIALGVLTALPELARHYYANPESIHGEAYRIRWELERAGIRISRALLGMECPVDWAASGTDLFSRLAALPELTGREVVVTPLEHPAVVANFGRTMKVAKEISASSACAARTHVQSEIGRIYDIASWSAACRAAAPEALLVCDTIQSAGKLDLPAGADIYTVSGHKLGAPGGAALLLATPRAQRCLAALRQYRSQEYRGGRPEPLTVLALALAVELAVEQREENLRRVTEVNTFLRAALEDMKLPLGGVVRCTVPAAEASAYILHLTLPGYQGAILVRILSERGVYVSSGSACQAEAGGPSAVLTAAGYTRQDAYAGLRLSFGFQSSLEEARRFLPIFQTALLDY